MIATRTQDLASEVLKIYIASQGLVFLTIERVNSRLFNITNPSDYQFTEVDLYHTLSQPQVLSQLQEQTRAQIVMRTFEACNQAIQIAIAKMPHQEAFDASKTATNFIQQLAILTDSKKAELNVNTFIWENLVPNEAREAIEYLRRQQAQPVIDSTEYQELTC